MPKGPSLVTQLLLLLRRALLLLPRLLPLLRRPPHQLRPLLLRWLLQRLQLFQVPNWLSRSRRCMLTFPTAVRCLLRRNKNTYQFNGRDVQPYWSGVPHCEAQKDKFAEINVLDTKKSTIGYRSSLLDEHHHFHYIFYDWLLCHLQTSLSYCYEYTAANR